MTNKTELINTILDCVNDSIDLDSNKVSLGVLIALLNDNIPQQLTIGGVSKSVNCEHKHTRSAQCEVDYCVDCDTYIPY